MTELSPQTQAVLNAIYEIKDPLDERVLKPQYIYVLTHEPQYTEMTRIKWGGSND